MELSFPWGSLGGRRSQLGVLAPGSFSHLPAWCPWVSPCPGLRFGVSTEATEVSYPRPLLCGLVKIESGRL